MKRRARQTLSHRAEQRPEKIWRHEDGPQPEPEDIYMTPTRRDRRRARSPPSGFLRRIVQRLDGEPIAAIAGRELAPVPRPPPGPTTLPVESAAPDREDLPRRPRQSRVPRWYSWKLFVTNYSATSFAAHPTPINLNPIVGGDDQDQRIGRLICMKRLEFRMHVRNHVTQQTTRGPYVIAGNGEVNPLDPTGPYTQTNGWTVPDSSPYVSTLYPPSGAQPGYNVTRGCGGRDVPSVFAETNFSQSQETFSYIGTGEVLAAATPTIATIAPGDITPLVAPGTAAVPYPGNAITPLAPIFFTQTIPQTPRNTVALGNDFQTYGARGYTVPPFKGAAPTNVPVATLNGGSSSGWRMQPFRVLIVYVNQSESSFVAPGIEFFLDATQPGNYFAGRYNYDHLRGSFEVIADHTINPGDVCEYTLVEEGIKMDHEVVFISTVTADASTGQLLAFLLCPGDAEQQPNPGQNPELAYGQMSVFYSDA